LLEDEQGFINFTRFSVWATIVFVHEGNERGFSKSSAAKLFSGVKPITARAG
jgi:hypothetical protein